MFYVNTMDMAWVILLPDYQATKIRDSSKTRNTKTGSRWTLRRQIEVILTVCGPSNYVLMELNDETFLLDSFNPLALHLLKAHVEPQ